MKNRQTGKWNKKNLRRISEVVTAQTDYNLDRLAKEMGYRERGRVIDDLVKDRMLMMNGEKHHERNKN